MAESALMQNNTSLWKRGLCWAVLLGPLFFLSYGQVNQFTATRHDVGSMVLGWEHAIPFMPWTIVPYWSIDLLYGISLFICTSRQELSRHGCRLLAASLIACVGFLLFPLKFTFVRPETLGIFGWLFQQLEQFDLPYNQAPSLHIILTWLLWLRFRHHLGKEARLLSGAWFLLIAVSVLTTWQHHFIDVVSGIVVGVLISYAIPVENRWRWKRPSEYAVRLAAKYCAGGIVCLLAGLWIHHCFALLWSAVALLMVAAGYAGLGVSVFQKNNHGDVSLSARLLLFPYLAGAWLSRKWFSRRLSLSNVIYDGVALGRFPDTMVAQVAVLDLTAEFHKGRRKTEHWEAYPLMDLVVPGVRDIHLAVIKLSQMQQGHESVLVCCALGLSRSATIVAAWLLSEGHAGSVTQAVALIKSRRPQVVLTFAHLQVLETFSKELQCQISP
ncbi:phosphatase PAP2/dual specificity phosphatase family protein [Citrobacter sp. JGM124]|uniref:phosphatase PAP2/dual specificity phosphatase family protein n=1 Tax=Citrobacter sp. JGM124 TaxID=2799789 RepID=UPI001BA7351D|nr:phosphatase PAP2/dual specificity phosphatase family protein [Citrobacter sp. JGM124]MBS0850055.1 phosphatase PAP2/dual specificity phosphatase family protein [Citrobacter sp. JGM124]